MSSEAKTMIEGLCSEDARKRESEAARIYLDGVTAACAAAMKWWEDEEINRLVDGDNRKRTVGVAVERETFVKIRAANGMPRLADVPSDQDAEEFELHFPNGNSLDILTSRAPGGDGAIARYLAKFGEGIQQVEFRCEDVDRATAILKEKFGVKAIYPETRAGADGTRVNFFLVPTAEGRKVLIELYEIAESKMSK
jgi:methylmalonyl-CoA/ethylmalonyl-CoA epimerase